LSIETCIEYATADDGVSLACTKFGSGPPLIYQFGTPTSSHFEMELAWPPAAATYQQFAEVATVIRYDPRNTGLSARGVEDVSFEAHLRDLDAVRRHFDVECAALMFPFSWARVAVEYAAEYPEHISALILPYPSLGAGRRWSEPGVDAVLSAAAAAGHELYAAISAVIWVGLAEHERAAWLAKFSLESVDFADKMRGDAVIGDHDATAAAARVRVPTLMIHRKLPQYNAGTASAEMIRDHRSRITRLSATIPGAESALFEGSSLWYSGDQAVTTRSIDFLRKVFAGRERAVTAEHVAPLTAGTRTVLFTDIVGHTEMMQRLGDAKGRDVLREHERITRETLKAHGGAEVKTMGDGFMASFGSATSAMECAIALQRAFASHTGSMLEPLLVRVGLNAGEPIEEDGDLFGATVILASRVCARADAGEILIPEPVRHLLAGKSYVYADRGETILKGFEDAVRLYEVRWHE
jgi:class 3 adenylate cyclase/pimeloyl-ACP methyl ester carboxylesterase